MERDTLKSILTDAGLPAATIAQVIEALEAHVGSYRASNRSILVRSAAKTWTIYKVVRSRVGKENGGPEWFNINNIKL